MVKLPITKYKHWTPSLRGLNGQQNWSGFTKAALTHQQMESSLSGSRTVQINYVNHVEALHGVFFQNKCLWILIETSTQLHFDDGPPEMVRIPTASRSGSMTQKINTPSSVSSCRTQTDIRNMKRAVMFSERRHEEADCRVNSVPVDSNTVTELGRLFEWSALWVTTLCESFTDGGILQRRIQDY